MRGVTGDTLFTLQFTYTYRWVDDEVYVAYYPPYNCRMLFDFLDRISLHAASQGLVWEEDVGQSIGGIPVPMLLISDLDLPPFPEFPAGDEFEDTAEDDSKGEPPRGFCGAFGGFLTSDPDTQIHTLRYMDFDEI